MEEDKKPKRASLPAAAAAAQTTTKEPASDVSPLVHLEKTPPSGIKI